MPDELPTVSVIIPCYKQAHFLRESVGSLLAQTYARVEVVVVDDGSPDDAAAAVARLDQRVVFIRQENRGACAARNAGIARSSGELLLFLDADDVLAPDAVALHMAARRTREPCVTCSGWDLVDMRGRLLEQHHAPVFEPDPFHALLRGNIAPLHCYMVPRVTLEEKVGFDESLVGYHEDWELWLRIAASGFPFLPISGFLARYRRVPHSNSQNHIRMYESGMKVLDRYGGGAGSCPLCRKAVRRARFFYYGSGFLAKLHLQIRAKPRSAGWAWRLLRSQCAAAFRYPLVLPLSAAVLAASFARRGKWLLRRLNVCAAKTAPVALDPRRLAEPHPHPNSGAAVRESVAI